MPEIVAKSPEPQDRWTSSYDVWMAEALDEGRQAGKSDDVPVGAVAVHDGAVIGRGRNRRVADGDPFAHAEMLALRAAAETLGTWRLDGVTLVVTLEPCLMCAGALTQARVERVVYGAADLKAGACGSLYNVCVDPRLPHEVEVVAGVRGAECAELLTAFFAARRA